MKVERDSKSAVAAALREAAGNVTDGLHEPKALVDLMRWIEGARQLAEELRHAAQIYPEFSALLAREGIAVNSPEWDAGESQGLEYVTMHLWECLNKVNVAEENCDEASHA